MPASALLGCLHGGAGTPRLAFRPVAARPCLGMLRRTCPRGLCCSVKAGLPGLNGPGAKVGQQTAPVSKTQLERRHKWDDAIGRLMYTYYNWRQDTSSDLVLVMMAFICLILANSMLRSLLLSAGPPSDLGAFWKDMYEVITLTFGQDFPGDSATVAHQVFSVGVAGLGLAGFALVLALVEQVVLEMIERNVRQGSRVYEQGHVLLLGWADSQRDLEVIAKCLEQLCYAHQEEPITVVVMTQRKKLDMESQFRRDIPEAQRYGTRFVFRQGNPLVVQDLEMVAAQGARTTIIISDQSRNPDEADAQSLRCAILLCELTPNPVNTPVQRTNLTWSWSDLTHKASPAQQPQSSGSKSSSSSIISATSPTISSTLDAQVAQPGAGLGTSNGTASKAALTQAECISTALQDASFSDSETDEFQGDETDFDSKQQPGWIASLLPDFVTLPSPGNLSPFNFTAAALGSADVSVNDVPSYFACPVGDFTGNGESCAPRIASPLAIAFIEAHTLNIRIVSGPNVALMSRADMDLDEEQPGIKCRTPEPPSCEEVNANSSVSGSPARSSSSPDSPSHAAVSCANDSTALASADNAGQAIPAGSPPASPSGSPGTGYNMPTWQYPNHVCVEMKTANAVPLLRFACSSRFMAVPTSHLNARRLAKIITEPIIASVSQQLIDFRNPNNLVVQHYPQLVGIRFSELGKWFDDAVVFGVYRGQHNRAYLNPSANYRVKQDDQLVLFRPNNKRRLQPMDKPVEVPCQLDWYNTRKQQHLLQEQQRSQTNGNGAGNGNGNGKPVVRPEPVLVTSNGNGNGSSSRNGNGNGVHALGSNGSVDVQVGGPQVVPGTAPGSALVSRDGQSGSATTSTYDANAANSMDAALGLGGSSSGAAVAEAAGRQGGPGSEPQASGEVKNTSGLRSYEAAMQCSSIFMVPIEYLVDDLRPRQVLVCGWGEQSFMTTLLRELDQGQACLPPGSEVIFVNQHDAECTLVKARKVVHVTNISTSHVRADPLQRSELAQVHVERFSAAIILCDERWIDPDQDNSNGVDNLCQADVLRLDSLVMLVQLNLRKLLEDQERPSINIICQKVAMQGLTRFEDRARLPLGISVNLTSYAAKVLTQAAYNPLFLPIHSEYGTVCDWKVMDVSELADEGEKLTWWQLAARAQLKHKVLVGWYSLPVGVDEPMEVVINPQGIALRNKKRTWNRGNSRLKLVGISRKVESWTSSASGGSLDDHDPDGALSQQSVQSAVQEQLHNQQARWMRLQNAAASTSRDGTDDAEYDAAVRNRAGLEDDV